MNCDFIMPSSGRVEDGSFFKLNMRQKGRQTVHLPTSEEEISSPEAKVLPASFATTPEEARMFTSTTTTTTLPTAAQPELRTRKEGVRLPRPPLLPDPQPGTSTNYTGLPAQRPSTLHLIATTQDLFQREGDSSPLYNGSVENNRPETEEMYEDMEEPYSYPHDATYGLHLPAACRWCQGDCGYICRNVLLLKNGSSEARQQMVAKCMAKKICPGCYTTMR
jgi:hypothetical protein